MHDYPEEKEMTVDYIKSDKNHFLFTMIQAIAYIIIDYNYYSVKISGVESSILSSADICINYLYMRIIVR